jgi:hypothetical protein
MSAASERSTSADSRLAPRLFAADPYVRYVAVNQAGRITEMEQRAEWSSLNPTESDRMEELIVNPIVLEAVTRRGNLDLNGVRSVIIRYGLLDEIVLPFGAGHVSVGVQQGGDLVRIAEKAAAVLADAETEPGVSAEPAGVERALRLALPRGLR